MPAGSSRSHKERTMRAILIAVFAALLLAGTAVAARLDYTLGLDAPVSDGDQANFTVTRSAPQYDTEWVSLTCDGGVGVLMPDGSMHMTSQLDFPVIWGTPDSLVGYVQFGYVFGPECTAVLTESPWNPKPKDLRITFPVN